MRPQSWPFRSYVGAPERNTNNLQHGAYANRFLDVEERDMFDALVVKLKADFKFNGNSDFMQVELAAMYFLKLDRAEEAGEWDVALKIDQALRCHLKDLKMSKIAREGDEPSGAESTPTEWDTSLLQEWDKSRKAKQARKVNETANDSNDSRQ